MTDIVYVVAQGDGNEELRYSLRSLAAHLPHGRVWIAGYRPAWVSDTVGHIDTAQTGSRFQNSTGNLRAACEHPDVAEDFVYFNDDFFVMQALEAVPVLHRGPLAEVIASTPSSLYRRGASATQMHMQRMGLADEGPLLSYELHVPLPVVKADMLAALDAGRGLPVLHKRTLYGNLCRIGGVQTADVKVKAYDDVGPDGPFVSTSDASFAGGRVGERIRAAFPVPCRYEAGHEDTAPATDVPSAALAAADGPQPEPVREAAEQPPAKSAGKAEWLAYADRQDPGDHSRMSKAELVAAYGG
ncbi:hypothetical protein [Streptomyces antibioticus]|uniref:hypothetical protein n=1 Tax=Streptomyces antibioticus TaxID=1890 RepID=UPI003D74D6F4